MPTDYIIRSQRISRGCRVSFLSKFSRQIFQKNQYRSSRSLFLLLSFLSLNRCRREVLVVFRKSSSDNNWNFKFRNRRGSCSGKMFKASRLLSKCRWSAAPKQRPLVPPSAPRGRCSARGVSDLFRQPIRVNRSESPQHLRESRRYKRTRKQVMSPTNKRCRTGTSNVVFVVSL